ncbi:MAG: response regulator [Peptoclostridium sp.]|uniref:sigma-54-dependent transcriptional regulator n=1 Tax=Peptoclostridium sp. TaxID=1904860 RepID=UPI00139E34A7|nr:sigma-54 dependent transcriptional regulator [Peptoclostridium sp.]MZQ74938.1 response regulator [Peptoclostridium sp.]
MKPNDISFKILIVDDELEHREVLQMIVEDNGYAAETAASGMEALEKLDNGSFQLVITDLIMEGMDGIELLEKIKAKHDKLEVIIITGYGTIENAVMAMQKGAFTYFVKGHDPEELLREIKKLTGSSSKQEEHELDLESDSNFMLRTKNKKFNKVLQIAKKAAQSNINILLLGESGVGKEVFSRYIHNCSQRKDMTFVPVNCQAFSDGLLESELFGHEKGAFTGAVEQRKGRFEAAHGGTLFLDELGEISLSTQVKLLRAIETKIIEKIGSNRPIDVDFRLICATNKNLRKEISKGSFREDFFYRISTISIEIPPLRERREDIPLLLDFFLEKASFKFNQKISRIEEGVMDFLISYDYPGNIRELKNIIERLVVLSEDGVILKRYLPELEHCLDEDEEDHMENVRPLRDVRRDLESRYIKKVLEMCEDNISEAARKLEISRRQLFNKIGEYGLK